MQVTAPYPKGVKLTFVLFKKQCFICNNWYAREKMFRVHADNTGTLYFLQDSIYLYGCQRCTNGYNMITLIHRRIIALREAHRPEPPTSIFFPPKLLPQKTEASNIIKPIAKDKLDIRNLDLYA